MDIDMDTIFSCIGGAIVFCVCCIQCHAGYNKFQSESAILEKQSWLQIQCRNESFYTNMKMFSNICDEIMSKKKPITQAMETIFNLNERTVKWYIFGWTMFLCKFIWNIIKGIIQVKDYINTTLPK